MAQENFVKVFDVLDSGYKSWPFAAFGLIFIVIGLILFFAPKFIKTSGIAFLDLKSKRSKVFRYVFLGFSIFWTITAFLTTFNLYQRHRALVSTGGCQTVEGPVENFIPMPASGHAMESFTVSGVTFSYSDYVVTDTFNNTSSHGGPIRGDSTVRICYDPATRQILRLEIRDFHGEIKDYGKLDLAFPKPGLVPGPGGKSIALPWYGNLFFTLYLLDLIALLALFMPYVRPIFAFKPQRWSLSRSRRGLPSVKK